MIAATNRLKAYPVQIVEHEQPASDGIERSLLAVGLLVVFVIGVVVGAWWF